LADLLGSRVDDDKVDRGRDSWLALAMRSKALTGRSGTSKRVASAAGKAE
jgi:hypothetical protein